MNGKRFVPQLPLFIGLLLLGLAGVGWSAETVDHSIYGELLERHVSDGMVDYQGFKTDEKTLDTYLQALEETLVDQLPPKEQMALYINAYNAYTIKLILENYPVDSIKDIGPWLKGPWKIRFTKVGGQALTLDEIEHDILRPRFKDARVHFAVNCASKSCPPLIAEPYEGSTLEEQLDATARAFINDPAENRLEGNTLYVSKIFKWFKKILMGMWWVSF